MAGYIATLRRNSDGMVLSFAEKSDMTAGEVLWAFTEGNYSCDCNRAVFFGDDDESCGETRFTLVELVLEGEVIYEEPKPRHSKAKLDALLDLVRKA